MKFISAGHCAVKGSTYDPGAIGVNGRKEADETVRIRNRVIEILKLKGHKDIVKDADGESLQQYLTRIKPGNASVVVEFHFNAASSPSATGVEVLIEQDGDKLDRAFARDLCMAVVDALNIKNRGVKSEADSAHKRLALMREEGILALVEVCFISNPTDMKRYDEHFEPMCQNFAKVIEFYDNLIN